MKKIFKEKVPSADQLATMADGGEDISAHFTNDGKMMPPMRRIDIDILFLGMTVFVGLPLWLLGAMTSLGVKFAPLAYVLIFLFPISIQFLILAGLIELCWIAYLLLRPNTFFDLEKRRQLGMSYKRLIPHICALCFIALTYACRDILRLPELLDALGRL